MVHPIVRLLTACEDIVYSGPSRHKVTLVNLVHAFISLDDPPFPHQRSEFCVFVELTECRTAGTMMLELEHADTGVVVHRTGNRPIPMADNPLKVIGVQWRIRGCLFPAPRIVLAQGMV